MNIVSAFERAFKRKQEKNWDYVYVLIDMHDTIFESDYAKTHTFKWLGESCEALQKLTSLKDVKTILWTGTHKKDIEKYLEVFSNNDIEFDYINENPEVNDTDTYCSDKIYFNIGIDDKFGFEPNTDWTEILNFLRNSFYNVQR